VRRTKLRLAAWAGAGLRKRHTRRPAAASPKRVRMSNPMPSQVSTTTGSPGSEPTGQETSSSRLPIMAGTAASTHHPLRLAAVRRAVLIDHPPLSKLRLVMGHLARSLRAGSGGRSARAGRSPVTSDAEPAERSCVQVVPAHTSQARGEGPARPVQLAEPVEGLVSAERRSAVRLVGWACARGAGGSMPAVRCRQAPRRRFAGAGRPGAPPGCGLAPQLASCRRGICCGFTPVVRALVSRCAAV
jgi:hypothetical protein